LEARLAKDRVLSWFDAGAAVANPSLLTGKVFKAGVEVTTLAWTPVVDVPSVFLSQKIKLLVEGAYEVVVYYDNVAIDTYPLNVGPTALADYPPLVAQTLKLPKSVAGANQTVSLKIIRSSTAGTSASIGAAYTAATATYNTSSTYTFPAVDTYVLVWYKVVNNIATPFFTQDVLVLSHVGKESVTFRVRNEKAEAIVNTTVVVSTAAGVQVVQGTTGSDGAVVLDISPGEYVVSLLKASVVFTNNNFAVEVVDANAWFESGSMNALDKWNNKFYLTSNTFTPTVSPPPIELAKCELFATFYRMDGTPLPHADVQVGVMNGPQVFSGTGAFDTRRLYKTDSNGYVSFSLLQGLTVEVLVTPIGLRRIIKVPSGADAAAPVNLLTLLGTAPDVFEIAKPNIGVAPKRSL